MDNIILSQEGLPIKPILIESHALPTDADSGASEGNLGQCLAPDAISGASAL